MTNQEAKAEAEKIIEKFKFYPGRDNSKQCAIIYCEGMIEEVEFIHDRMIKSDFLAAAGAIYSRIQFYRSVLTEIENTI